jgi:hypothetical protein
MLRFFYRPDRLDNIEANMVAEAANRLGVGEFQFFRLAHEQWFGRTVEPEALEPAFMDYMLDDKVPHYVRHYARAVIGQDDRGQLEPGAERYHRFDQGTERRAASLAGATTVALVLLITAIFLGLTIYTYEPRMPPGEVCNYPPCPSAR